MKFLLCVSLFCLFFGFTANAQSRLIAPYISSWKDSDTSQTHSAEKTYSLLKDKKDVAEYHQIVKEMYAYLKDSPDDRLWIRTVMYDIFGRIELGIWTEAEFLKDRPLLLKCIKLASQLNDDQLMAELYAQYAELSRKTSNYVLYNLKAIELQKRVGISHFAYVPNRYYNVSLGLYSNEDYKQSINYGLKCLTIIGEDKNLVYRTLYIMQTDIIGASYFMLGKIDSSKLFYQKIIDVLTKKPDLNSEYQQLWLAIAKGNIGKVLALQNQDDKAILLIREHLRVSLNLRSFNNVAIAKNNLGAIYLKNSAYAAALSEFRNAYQYATKDNLLNEKVKATKGSADAFRALKQTDSAFAYYNISQLSR